MLDGLWLLVVAFVEVWALWARHGLVILAASLALLVSTSLVVMRRVALAGVTFHHSLSANQATFGEVIDFTVELTNLKLLPLTWIRVEDSVPRELSITGGRIETDRSRFFRCLVMVVALLPYQRVTRRLKVGCTRRGQFRFGPARFESGDYLGVLSAYGGSPEEHDLLVFPKVLPLELGTVPSQLLMGRDSVRRPFLTDPMRVIGARAYQPGDAYRLIDWRATARCGTLMTRILEPSSTPVLDVVLDFAGPNKEEKDYSPDELELAFCVVASLVRHALTRRMAVGVRGNGQSGRALLEVPPSARDGQERLIMEALARANTLPCVPLTEVMQQPSSQIPSGATTVIVTAAFGLDLQQGALDLQRKRHPLLIIHVAVPSAEAPAEALPVVKVPYEPGWSTRESLVLAA